MTLKDNQIIREAKTLKMPWGLLILYYVIYLLSFVAGQMIMMRFVTTDRILSLLGACVITTSILLLFVMRVGKRSLKSLGMQNQNVLKNLFLGWLIGAISLLLIWGINWLFGGVRFDFNSNFNILLFLLLFVGFTVQGFMEEFLLRGLIFTQISVKWGVISAIIINSVWFALGHTSNSNASFISTVNTFLMAVLLSLMFYYHENIWIISGLHSGWNFILGGVLGVTVSGFKMPTSLLETGIVENRVFLNGGLYGFEASYLVTAMMIGGIIWYAIILKKNISDKAQG